MLKMVDGTGIIGVDMVCPLGGTVSPPQPPNYDNIEMEGVGSLMLPNSLKAPLERLELIGNSVQGENPAPDNLQEIKSAGRFDTASGKYLIDVKVTGKNLFNLTDNYIWGWFAGYQTQISLYSVNAVVYMPCKPNTTYTIYGRTNINGNNNVKNRVATANDFPAGGTKLHNITETQLSNPVTITTDELSKYLVIMAVTDNECDMSTREQVLKQNVSKMMVIIGNAPTPYEPYTEQSVQIALDEPLRGVGEYKDVLTKDGVVRKIHEQTLKKEQISMNEYNWDTKYFRLYVKPDKKIDSSINIHELFSNMFKKFVIYKNNPNVYWIISEEEIRSIGITEADSLQVAYEKIKGFVTTNDIVVQYPIVETTLEPLPESVQAQLQALHTENGITHVFVDFGEVECGIKLTYRKEK